MLKKNKKLKKKKNDKKKENLISDLKARYWIISFFFFILAGIIFLSFYEKAGIGGKIIFKTFNFLIGQVVFFVPLLLIVIGIFFLKSQRKKFFFSFGGGLLILLLTLTSLLEILTFNQERTGGILGYLLTWPFLKLFGTSVSLIFFIAFFVISLLILWEFFPKTIKKIPEISEKKLEKEKEEKPLFELKLPKLKTKKLLTEKKEKELLKTPFSAKTEEKELIAKFKEEYKFPPIELLSLTKQTPLVEDIENNSLIIQKTLANFGIEVEMGEVSIGPTVTQYTLKPAEGVKLSKITALSNDLALTLASHPIRIEAPIPGKSLVGVEVPNKGRAVVSLRELLSEPKFQEASPLTFSLGKNVSGAPLFADLEKMPHLLVAGSTGTGKTIFLQILILSLIFRNSPQFLKLILIDPKRVEFPIYSSLPHLFTPVIYNPNKSAQVLNWLIGEMERRFELLGELGVRDIQSFNKIILKNPKLKEEYNLMPYIILIIDELADLMAAKGREIESAIVRLSQLSRATGIHLVVATQRPSVDVITGLIKANFTSRIAFQVATQTDSRTILDMAGAEKLLGKGDMLFLSSESGKPRRIQCCWVDQKEVKKVVDFIQKENPIGEKEIIEERLIEELEGPEKEPEFTSLDYDDPLYEEAKKVILEYRKASASLLQRRLKIGYARAARLLDVLEEKGIIGPADGAKPREVYLFNDSNNLKEHG